MLVERLCTTMWQTTSTRKVTIKTSKNLLLAISHASTKVSLDRKKPYS